MKLILTLLLSGISILSAQTNCKDIHIITDNLSGSIKYESPLTFDMQYSKTISKTGDTVYNLFLQAVVTYTNGNEKGCILYLSDGSKIEFPEQHIAITNMPLLRYKYSTILTLTKADISRLSTFDIVDFRMHVHNSPLSTVLVKKKNAKVMTDYLKCIVAGTTK